MGTNEAQVPIQSGVVRTPHLFGTCATIKERYLQFVYVELTANGPDHALKPVFVSQKALWVVAPCVVSKLPPGRSESSWIASLGERDRSGVPEGKPIFSEASVIAVKTERTNDASAEKSEVNSV